MTPNPYIERGRLLLMQSRFEQSEQELRRALGEDPEDPLAYGLLGMALVSQGRHEEGVDACRRSIELAPDEDYGHFAMAVALGVQGRLDESLQSLSVAIRIAPDKAHYHGQQAAILIQKEDHEGALRAARRGLQFDSEDAECLQMQAVALQQLGRMDEAAAAGDAALASAPDSATAHSIRGWTCLRSNQSRQALEHFREALRLDPTTEHARTGMVEALKARHLLYRLMLAWFNWMLKLPPAARWGVVIALYLLYVNLPKLRDRVPASGLIIGATTALLFAFFLLTWTAPTLFNLLLRLNRFGRHILSRRERIVSTVFGVFLLGAIAAGVGFAATGMVVLLLAAVWSGATMIITTIIDRFDHPLRSVPAWLGVGVSVLGLAAVLMIGLALVPEETGFGVMGLFGWSFFGYLILANVVGSRG